MNSFPTISYAVLCECFDRIASLYSGDKVKLLQAAVRATSADISPFILTLLDVDLQIPVVRAKVLRTADREGQVLLIKLIEELYDDLIMSSGAIGVTPESLIEATKFKFFDDSYIQYSSRKIWVWYWDLQVDTNTRIVELEIRGKNLYRTSIVQDYVLQFVQQAMIAFQNSRPAAALSLMAIGLEGTLRDALELKGFFYSYGTPSQDVYALEDMFVHKNTLGYLVTFPGSMPQSLNNFLSYHGSPTHEIVKIKRVLRDGRSHLEIRQADNLIDYWSSDRVVQTGQRQISGLGAAIDVGRNYANIITPTDLPPDLDQVIKTVRNHLIHLSGSNMNDEVALDSSRNPITLKSFLENKNRVFDAVCTIGDTINVIYKKIATNTL